MSAEKRLYFARALAALAPEGMGWGLDDSVDTYEDIIWGDPTNTISKTVLTSKADELEAAAALLTHQEPRHKAYPSLHEFADAIYWSENGDRTKLDAWLAACAAVKERYPKPE